MSSGLLCSGQNQMDLELKSMIEQEQSCSDVPQKAVAQSLHRSSPFHMPVVEQTYLLSLSMAGEVCCSLHCNDTIICIK